MKILIPVFTPPVDSLGSLSRVLALGRHFIEQGHDVLFCASGKMRRTFIERGYNVYPTKTATILGLPKALSDTFLRFAALYTPVPKPGISRGSIYGLYALCGLSGNRRLVESTEEILAAIDDFNPDFIFTELDPGTYLAAIIRNIPLVSTYASVGKTGYGTWAWKRMRKAINHVLKKYSVPKKINPEEVLERRGVYKIIPSIPELETTDPLRKDICFTGSLTETVPKQTVFTPEPGKKYIFVYLGTGSVPLRKAVKILPEAVKNRDDLICIFASRMFSKETRQYNCRFIPYIHAQELLPHCILTICHGGLNTIIQSLSFAVPLLIYPGALFERRFNAVRVAQTGAGLFKETADFSVQTISETLENLAEIKAGAEEIKQKVSTYHGTETAYHAIMEWYEKEKENGYESF